MKNAKSAIIFLLIASAILLIPMMMSSYEEKEVSLSVAFYNVENLFDTVDDSTVNDNAYLPDSKKVWDSSKYYLKIQHLGEVIKQLSSSSTAPDILGLAEIENRKVLQDLIKMSGLGQFEIVHEESPDKRGIDVALLYDTSTLDAISYKIIPVKLSSGKQTRDILYTVLANKDNDILHIMVNHWPSRYGGQKKSEPFRLEAARTAKTLIDSILNKDSMAQVIVMGDFNDGPNNRSISEVLDAGDQKDNILFNPFLGLAKNELGSYKYRNNWDMLDQIIVSHGLWDYNSLDYVIESSKVFERPWLIQKEGKFKGYPFRTFGGNDYLAGYSDHLPVMIDLYRTKH